MYLLVWYPYELNTPHEMRILFFELKRIYSELNVMPDTGNGRTGEAK